LILMRKWRIAGLSGLARYQRDGM
jgi:Type I restriction modification DNA specificity domain.